ncbi:phosphohistidine phosphatase SixA [Pseudomonadota bacterium]
MRLYLVQHGQALSKEEHTDRPLSEAGQDDVGRLAAFLKAADIKVSQTLHSGKTRAQQTAEILAASIMPQGQVTSIEGISPNDPTDQLIEQIKGWDRDTLVVGHLPYMARLVSQLVSRQQDYAITGFKPGTLVCLEETASESWEITLMLQPAQLQMTHNN